MSGDEATAPKEVKIRLPRDQAARLERAAQEMLVSQREVVRRALDEYLERCERIWSGHRGQR